MHTSERGAISFLYYTYAGACKCWEAIRKYQNIPDPKNPKKAWKELDGKVSKYFAKPFLKHPHYVLVIINGVDLIILALLFKKKLLFFLNSN
jgi:hypothetical protein